MPKVIDIEPRRKRSERWGLGLRAGELEYLPGGPALLRDLGRSAQRGGGRASRLLARHRPGSISFSAGRARWLGTFACPSWSNAISFELDGRVYESPGVLRFKRYLMGLVSIDASRPSVNAYILAGRSAADVAGFERRARRSEAIHLFGLAVSIALLIGAVSLASWSLALSGAVVFFANFHCYILQRYNRARAWKLLRRMGDRARGATRGRSGPPG